jgi:hypothetical protein
LRTSFRNDYDANEHASKLLKRWQDRGAAGAKKALAQGPGIARDRKKRTAVEYGQTASFAPIVRAHPSAQSCIGRENGTEMDCDITAISPYGGPQPARLIGDLLGTWAGYLDNPL